MSSKTAIVHKEGSEETLLIDARTGFILTAPEDRPSWHDGEVNALLAERTHFYMTRLGTVPEDAQLHYEDLGWIGLDAEGDEVEIEANMQWRMERLGELLGLDTSVEGFDKAIEGQVASVMVHSEMVANPTDEKTLEEAQDKTFSEVAQDEQKVSATG